MVYNIKELVDRVYQIPELKKLSNFRCFDYIQNNFTTELGQIIKDISYKKGVLYFYVQHPAHKMYLQYQLQNIETLLKESSDCAYISENLKNFNIRVLH